MTDIKKASTKKRNFFKSNKYMLLINSYMYHIYINK